MRSLTLLFYAFATLAIGSIAVASGGVRAIAVVLAGSNADIEAADRMGVWLTLGVAAVFLVAAIVASFPGAGSGR